MIIIVKKNTPESQLWDLTDWLEAQSLHAQISRGDYSTVVGVIGDTSRLDADAIRSLDFVETVMRVSEPYRMAGRRNHPADTVVDVSGVKIGGGSFVMIAGPCSVESREQILAVAEGVKAAGAQILRGGAYKPRSSPYDFQGLHREGLELLLEAKKETGLPVVTEIMSAEQLPLYDEVDMIQVGARNMQNYELLKELAPLKKPILLKRGFSASLRDLLMAAEYLMAGGTEQIVLCERGIRSFETQTRNTLDLSAVPALHELSHLPVIVDPSHGTGVARYVPSMSLAAAAAGADGLMIEVHNDPQHALCDGPQALTPEQYRALARRVERVRGALRD